MILKSADIIVLDFYHLHNPLSLTALNLNLVQKHLDEASAARQTIISIRCPFICKDNDLPKLRGIERVLTEMIIIYKLIRGLLRSFGAWTDTIKNI